MSATDPQGGHDVVMAIELNDGVAAPGGAVASAGTFVQIGWQRNNLTTGLGRNKTAISGRKHTISTHIVSALMNHEPISGTVEFLEAHNTHDDETGLWAHFLSHVTFGMMYQGPEYTIDVKDAILISGELESVNRSGDEDAGEYLMSYIFQPSGPFKMDAVIHGVRIP